MELTVKNIKELLIKNGYYAEEELVYDMLLGLFYMASKDITVGQDIFATCLSGPPGAGKTFYAEIYQKIASQLFNENITLIEYQCDATTGKNELFEDINISAAIKRDADHVNVEGKLVEAIKKVNEGKKVILFIDEYDKAREETDAFLLQFLQSGKINTNQFGDLQILKEYKSNLQVILCKNDFRENLSGPLSRRLRMIRLDYMKPDVFYKVARKTLIDSRKNPISEGILNLVSTIYKTVYEKRDLFIRIPSCSEMLLTLQDTDNLVKYGNAPKYIIYKNIINGIFKENDDIDTFENGLQKLGNADLKDLIEEMSKKEIVTEESLLEIISKTMLKDREKILDKKMKEIEAEKEKLNKQYEELNEMIEAVESFSTGEEQKEIKLGSDTLTIKKDDNEAISNFDDEQEYLKRGKSVFTSSTDDFIEVGNINVSNLDNAKLLESTKKNKIVIYENGFELLKNPSVTFIMTRKNNINNQVINLLTDSLIVSGDALSKIINILKKLDLGTINHIKLNLLVAAIIKENDNFVKVAGLDNVFNVKLEGNDLSLLTNLKSSMNDSECKEVSNKLLCRK